nr:hypothetical protein CFP56_75138 [Quercus suber]
MPVEFLATAAIAVEDVAVAASEFTLIQPWGGGVQHGYEAVWDFEDRQASFLRPHDSSITKIIVKVMKDC